VVFVGEPGAQTCLLQQDMEATCNLSPLGIFCSEQTSLSRKILGSAKATASGDTNELKRGVFQALGVKDEIGVGY